MMQGKAIGPTLDMLGLVMRLMFPDKRWFVSFGSLLNFVRDSGRISGDIDLSVFSLPSPDRVANTFSQFRFMPKKTILDKSGSALFMSFERDGMEVDLFRWVKAGDYYYHTYDVEMVNPASGILDYYVFKGCPAHLLEADTVEYLWPDERVKMRFPLMYGSLLDFWYPGWIIPNSQFGQSASDRIIRATSEREIERASKDQGQKSATEYESLKRRICGQNA